MSDGTFKLSRRTLLRGTVAGVGVAVGLGPLDAMFDGRGRAFGATPAPKRLITLFFGNGVYHPAWLPRTEGKAPVLAESLAPLDKVRRHVRIISGLDNTGGGSGHEIGLKATLMGLGKTSADQLAAQHLGATRFPSLQYALFKEVKRGVYHANMSFRDGAAVPPEFSPRRAFDRLFGAAAAASTDPKMQRLRRHQLSVLDAVKGEATRLGQRLGAADRARMDAHLTAVRELERSLQPAKGDGKGGTLWPAACKIPVPPTAAGPKDYPRISRQLNEIITLALACDQARAISYMMTSVQSQGFMPWLNLPGEQEHLHACSHGGGWQLKITKTVAWQMGEFADLVARLAAVDEGAGKLIDSTGLIITSETGHADSHGGKDMPIVIAGGPAIVGGDTHWRGSGGTAGVTLSLLKAVGCPIDSFGRETTPIPIV